MSWDLSHWYLIRDKKGAKPIKQTLQPLGYWDDASLGTTWCLADDTIAFEELVKRVCRNCRNPERQKYFNEELIQDFEKRAKEFKEFADEKGYIIRTEWF